MSVGLQAFCVFALIVQFGRGMRCGLPCVCLLIDITAE